MPEESTRSSIRKLFRLARKRDDFAKQPVNTEDDESDGVSDEAQRYDAQKAKLLAREDPHLPNLLAAVKDWQLTHGSLIKLALHQATYRLPLAYTVLAQPIGVSLVPTVWPEERFQEAWELQSVLQELYAKIASDPSALYAIYKDCIAGQGNDGWNDEIISALWKVYEAVRDDPDGLGHVQDVDMSICRGDWMLDLDTTSQEDRNAAHTEDGIQVNSYPTLKQVEFNAMATAGGSHSTLISQMHRFMLRSGIYSPLSKTSKQESTAFNALPRFPLSPKLAPAHDSIQAIASALAAAHKQYGDSKVKDAYRTAILMLVQHDNVNIADERPIEYALWNMDSPVPCFRVEYREVMNKTWFPPTAEQLTAGMPNIETGRELLFNAHSHNSEIFEISVVYHRGSITTAELMDVPFPDKRSQHTGLAIRIHLERSKAIKCPSVLGQLAAGKKVQEHLYSTLSTTEMHIGAEAANRLHELSMSIYSLADGQSNLRQLLDKVFPLKSAVADTRAHGTNVKAAEEALTGYVLKPVGAEGGGSCIFGRDIPEFYHEHIVPAESHAGYMLQHRIHPPVVKGALMSPRGYHVGPVVSELGILGTVMFRSANTKKRQYSNQGTSNAENSLSQSSGEFEILSNETVGWTLKSKSEDVPEISVIKGYGCFDTPCLVDWPSYLERATPSKKDW